MPKADDPTDASNDTAAGDLPRLSPEALQAESARGRLAALFALGSVLLTSASLIVSQSVSKSVVTAKDAAEFMTAIHGEKAGVILAAALFAIGTGLTIPVLLHLAVATRVRRPKVPAVVVQLSVAGPLVLAVVIPLTAVLYVKLSGDFASGTDQTVKAAKELFKDTALVVTRSVALVGSFAAGFAWVMIGAYGIRTGLLTRLIGSVCVGAGLLTAIGTNVMPAPVEVLKLFLLGAIAVMLVGAPEKRPPAWNEGRSVPWPPLGGS